MIKAIKYVIYIILVFSLLTCRKKSDVNITVYNYAMSEPIAFAEVGIFEVRYKGSIFSASAECKEIAHATADENGRCIFDNVKLKNTKAVQYVAKIKYAYGKAESYNCNVTQNSEVLKTGTNNLVLNNNDFDAYFKVQYNNLLNPSQSGDTLVIGIASPKYSVPNQPYPFGGGGVFYASPYFGCNGYPFASSFQTIVEKQMPEKMCYI